MKSIYLHFLLLLVLLVSFLRLVLFKTMKIYSYFLVRIYYFSSYISAHDLLWVNFFHILWKRGPNSFFCMRLSSCPSVIYWKDYSFHIEFFWHPCGKSIDHKGNGLLWILNYILYSLYIYMSILMPGQHCLDYCSFVVSFEIGKCEFSDLILFQNSFDYPGDFAFPY